MPLTSPLIAWTEKGLFCRAGDFYIDPHRAVDTAVVTHAHSDHARRGSKRYLCAQSGVGLLKSRIGKNIQVQGIPFGETFQLGSVQVSLHPAGHILGSAQVRVEHRGEVWVASGDYKRDPDPSCEPFESVTCDTFITEATFGTPKYAWKKDSTYGLEIHDWWLDNASQGWNSVLFGYSLGKAQRILTELASYAQRPVIIHESISELTECYRSEGRALAPTRELSMSNQVDLFSGEEVYAGELILAPPSILKLDSIARLGKFKTAFASGWMQQSGYSNYDHGFVMSDHADWNDLNRTIDESQAKRVFVQHRNGALVRHLRSKGIDAHPDDALIPENFQRLAQINLSLFP
jgi:putative mRNA 3-end processing factor